MKISLDFNIYYLLIILLCESVENVKDVVIEVQVKMMLIYDVRSNLMLDWNLDGHKPFSFRSQSTSLPSRSTSTTTTTTTIHLVPSLKRQQTLFALSPIDTEEPRTPFSNIRFPNSKISRFERI